MSKFEKPALVLFSAFALTLLLMNLEFNLLEANLYDFRMSRGHQATPSSEIVTITIDDSTLKTLNEFLPLPLDLHARFLEQLTQYQPKAIGYLTDFTEVIQGQPEKYVKEWSKRFTDASEKFINSGFPKPVFLLGTSYDVTGEVLPPFPLSQLPHAVAIIHKDGNVFSEDKITRRALTYLYGKPVFHLELAQKLGLAPIEFRPRGNFLVSEIESEYFFFRYHGNPVAETNSNYQRISFQNILDPEKFGIEKSLLTKLLKDKIVLVGSLSKGNSQDFAFTPYSKSPFKNPKILLHANIIDSILQNDGITLAPNWINWIITFTLTATVFWWVLQSTPLYGVFATFGLALISVLLAHFIFSYQSIWIRQSQPLIGLFVSYYLTVPYRLIVEYKKRWDYQRKNEILLQVEELKTNFLSLITHDLRTPVARVQGLVEVLARKIGPKLNESENQTVKSILNATEDLNHFITGVLELTKIESNRVQLQLQTKDLNTLVERAVEQFQTIAKVNNIKINVQLEPLFPISMDAALIQKVINNLVDNAIKYTRHEPDSKGNIWISTQEIENFVVLNVRDEGIGLSPEEQNLLFTRFYRAKNDTTTKISGTGLGLYLTKYFVELHHGYVEVASELNQGSTFKIFLPLKTPVEQQIREKNLRWSSKVFSSLPNPSDNAKPNEETRINV